MAPSLGADIAIRFNDTLNAAGVTFVELRSKDAALLEPIKCKVRPEVKLI
jgi:hypothetical protein